jgi:hypothetical protein
MAPSFFLAWFVPDGRSCSGLGFSLCFNFSI